MLFRQLRFGVLDLVFLDRILERLDQNLNDLVGKQEPENTAKCNSIQSFDEYFAKFLKVVAK